MRPTLRFTTRALRDLKRLDAPTRSRKDQALHRRTSRAVWVNDVEVTFADGTFGCDTTQMVTVTCTWDADGGMAQGRNALPSDFDAGENKDFFLKCEAN